MAAPARATSLFIVGGILPVVYLAVRMFAGRNRPGTVALDEVAQNFTTVVAR